MRRITYIITLIIACMIYDSKDIHAQHWSVGINMAEMLDLGTISAEASVAAGRHLTVNVSASVNPWTFNKGRTEQMQNRCQTYSAGVRWWPWHVYSGWWVGCKAQYQEYNRGGVFSDRTQEGDAFGAAVSGGYSIMLGEHINLDFGLGLWGGYKKYVTYACTSCGKQVDSGEKWFLWPDELILALVWTF